MQSQLPDWVDGRRALRVVARALHKQGMTAEAQARLLNARGLEPRLLPGFNVFDSTEKARALDWCAPAKPVDRDEMIGLWEEFVDNNLGRLPRPDRILRRAFLGATSDEYFGAPREALQWWKPAAKFIAVAARAFPGKLTWDSTWVKFDMGDYQMAVYYNAAWSNTYGRLVRTSALADDADISQFDVPALTTEHPLAHALPRDADPGLLWAVNTAIRTEAAGMLDKVRAPHLELTRISRTRERPRVSRAHRTIRLGQRAHADIRGAIQALRDELANPDGPDRSTLFEIAVPVLMSVNQFEAAGGGSRNTSASLPMRTASINKLSDHLDMLEAEL